MVEQPKYFQKPTTIKANILESGDDVFVNSTEISDMSRVASVHSLLYPVPPPEHLVSGEYAHGESSARGIGTNNLIR